MKLKNKLLPLVGVATACAAVAPIATSCKLSTDSTYTDLLTLYKPTIKMYSEETGNNDALGNHKANKAYFGDAENGWTDETTLAERIQQDFFWSKSYAAYYLSSGGSKRKASKFDNINAKFNYIKIGHETVYTSISPKESHDVVTMSFQLEYNGSLEYTDYEDTTKRTQEGIVTVTNLPVWVEAWENDYTGDTMWHILPCWGELHDEYVLEDATITKIPYTFNHEYTYAEEYITSEGTTTRSSKSDISYYPALITSGESFDERKAAWNEFSNVWDNTALLGLNFTSYYLYGNGVSSK